MSAITLSLISHTNVGKTTLARTLLRRDVGEIRDQAHVTLESDVHVLLEADGDEIRLWDTPGFGDTARLLRRLRRSKDPIGWFLHQIWDRLLDRPLFCSQQAVRNVREQADVVLYLVNAAEDPEDAGYVALELELLGWLERPVLLILNQLEERDEKLEERWRDYCAQFASVRDVLSLDAFSRCWVEEGILLERVAAVLEGDEHRRMTRLAEHWNERNVAVFGEACAELGDYLARAAIDCEVADTRDDADSRGVGGLLTEVLRSATVDRKRSIATLGERLDGRTDELMQRLIVAHGLSGAGGRRIERSLQDFQVRRGFALGGRSGALAGAVISGALGGLAADALSGGLTLGGGMIAGGILGALGGSALAKGIRWAGGETRPSVRWTPEFLDQLARQVVLRYLAVAHFGRGRGAYRDLARPEHWERAVDDAFAGHDAALQRCWDRAERDGASIETLGAELGRLVRECTVEVLRRAYPDAPQPS
ncbi:MAG: GTPase domain-containing protein [bacterium]|nr:GTPase domain-containing protein [bacterium]